jgi:hypothetical protein
MPAIIARDSGAPADAVHYGAALVLLVAVYWLAHRFPGVKFDFNLRWRFKAWDLLIIVGFALLTTGGLAAYMYFYSGTHSAMAIFGSRAGSTPPLAYWGLGVLFALLNAVIEEFWFGPADQGSGRIGSRSCCKPLSSVDPLVRHTPRIWAWCSPGC